MAFDNYSKNDFGSKTNSPGDLLATATYPVKDNVNRVTRLYDKKGTYLCIIEYYAINKKRVTSGTSAVFKTAKDAMTYFDAKKDREVIEKLTLIMNGVSYADK